MGTQFKPVRFFVLMAIAAFFVCGVTAFFTQRAARGHSEAERSAYAVGEKAGRGAPAGTVLPTDAALNMMAQKYFATEGKGEPMAWKHAFERGYADGLTKSRKTP